MNSTDWVNCHGDLRPLHEAFIPATSRGFLFGDSIYETTLAQKNKAMFLAEHLERLQQSAQLVDLNISQQLSTLAEEVQRTLQRANHPHSIVRIVLVRSGHEMQLPPEENQGSEYYIYVRKFSGHPQQWYQQGVPVIISDVRRNHPQSLNPMAKTGNYLNNLLALMQARKQGAHDAVMLNHQEQLTEGTTNNIWFVKNGEVYTPHLDCGLLNGITRLQFLKICDQLQLKVHQGFYYTDDLLNAEEAFYTSSTKGAVPITTVNQRPIGNGQVGLITQKLQKGYQQAIERYFA